jgi:hypothetical protein
VPLTESRSAGNKLVYRKPKWIFNK